MTENEELRAEVARLAKMVSDLALLLEHSSSGREYVLAQNIRTDAHWMESRLNRPAA